MPDASTRSKSNGWSFLTIAAVASAVGFITAFVVQHYTAAADAASILGIVIPVFATVGAAVFGVTAAYQAGATTGSAGAGPAAEQQLKDDLAPNVKAALDAVGTIVSAIQTQGDSPPGEDQITIQQSNARPVVLSHDQLNTVLTNLSALAGKVGV
jgi:hypothetical protein